MSIKFHVENAEQWAKITEGLPTESFAASIDGEGYCPRMYPCLTKMVETITVNDNNEEVQSFIFIFFYRDDAFELLGLQKSIEIEGYTYAESQAG